MSSSVGNFTPIAIGMCHYDVPFRRRDGSLELQFLVRSKEGDQRDLLAFVFPSHDLKSLALNCTAAVVICRTMRLHLHECIVP